MRICIAIAFWLLSTALFAQVETQVTPKKALLGVTNPVIQGSRILVGDDSNVAVSDVVVLDVKTEFKFSRIRARRDGARVEPEKLGDGQYLFSGAGSYVVEVTAFDPEKGIDDSEVTFTIGKPKPPEPGPTPEPEPEPQPGPDVVPNEYNLGKVALSSAPSDPAMAKQIAGFYRAGASKLYGIGGLSDVQSIVNEINRQFAAKQCRDQATCEAWGRWNTAVASALRAEQLRRTSFTREQWYAALSEIATALEAVK